MPDGWTAVLRGGGFTIDGVRRSDGSTPVKVTLNVTVPADAAASTQQIDVKGVTSLGRDDRPCRLDIRVSPNAAGNVTLTTDTPQLKGASDTSFTFSLTLTNNTADDLPFSATATGPDGWTVTAADRLDGAGRQRGRQGRQQHLGVGHRQAADGAAAGDYPIAVDATSGSQKAHADLQVTITGSYSLAMSTPNGVLSMNATAGSATRPDAHADQQRDRRHPGRGHDAPARRPAGSSSSIRPRSPCPAGETVQVVAHVTPSSDAITGDYVTTMTATAPLATAKTDIRVTVQTSALWGVIGIGLIAIVLLGLWLVFRRFGRR